MAAGAVQAVQDAGMRVPDDIAVIGFDDLPTASNMKPKLTSVRQPVLEKGGRATELLLDLIDGTVKEPRRVLLDTELVIRESCGGQIS